MQDSNQSLTEIWQKLFMSSQQVWQGLSQPQPGSQGWPTLNGIGSFSNWPQLLHKALELNPFDQFKGLANEAIHIDPTQLTEIQRTYLQEYNTLVQTFFQSSKGAQTIPFFPSDRRFMAQEWHDHGFFELNAAVYLINAKTMMQMAEALIAEPKVKNKIRFAVQQWIDASAPSNFLCTNPEAQKYIIESKGESLRQGMINLFDDISKGRISQVDEHQFEVGRTVATTPGQVVYENALFQLIQYQPTTERVGSQPLLMVPPCINKYYILDLRPENSFIRYCVDQGITVFIVSWCNAMEQHRQLTWDDYIEEGIIEAIKTVRAISAQPRVNVLGFCIGGTLLAAGLAVLAARRQHIVESLTLLTTLLDFSDPGTLEVYVDEPSVAMREQNIGKGGLMNAQELASAFSSLRPNDLIWNYVVNNYLKGQRPPAFDLLYWNADSTNLPGPMFCWYLRNTYLENNLQKPQQLKCCGVSIDLGKINIPTYILATIEDHIVPWMTAYSSTKLLNQVKEKNLRASVRFILGSSGHVSGVINPPKNSKRNYWVNEKLPEHPQKWLSGAKKQSGSWWNDWSQWLKPNLGKMVAAPVQLGSSGFKPIEPAPGRYVKVRAE